MMTRPGFLFECFMVCAQVFALSLFTAARHNSTERCDDLINPVFGSCIHMSGSLLEDFPK